jgi:hypothetical protein
VRQTNASCGLLQTNLYTPAGFFLGVFGEVVTQAFHPLAGLELGVLCLWYDDGLVDGKEVTGLG